MRVGEFESPFLSDPLEWSKEFGNKLHPDLVARDRRAVIGSWSRHRSRISSWHTAYLNLVLGVSIRV